MEDTGVVFEKKILTFSIPPKKCALISSPLHVGISLRSALKGTLSVSLSVTLADETRKSPLIETHIRIYVQLIY